MPARSPAPTLHSPAHARDATADELPAVLVAVTIDGAMTARDDERKRAAHALIDAAADV